MAGPGDGNLPGVAQERGFVAGAPRLRLVTMHRYPLIACATDPPRWCSRRRTTCSQRVASAGLANDIEPYVRVARAAGLRYRLDEMNSVVMPWRARQPHLRLGAVGARPALPARARRGQRRQLQHLHRALYEPFGVTESRGQWSAQVRPMYYGMLMFAQAAPPGSRLLQLQLHGRAPRCARGRRARPTAPSTSSSSTTA